MTVHPADIEEAHEVASLVQARREALGVIYLSRIATALEKIAETPAYTLRECDHACESCEQEHDAAQWQAARRDWGEDPKTGVPLAAPMCEPGCPQLVTYEHTPENCFRPVARGGISD